MVTSSQIVYLNSSMVTSSQIVYLNSSMVTLSSAIYEIVLLRLILVKLAYNLSFIIPSLLFCVIPSSCNLDLSWFSLDLSSFLLDLSLFTLDFSCLDLDFPSNNCLFSFLSLWHVSCLSVECVCLSSGLTKLSMIGSFSLLSSILGLDPSQLNNLSSRP